MSILIAIVALAQVPPQGSPEAKPEVQLQIETPGEKWPISGTVDLPNETMIEVTLIRLERRYDDAAKRFQEVMQSRVQLRAEVRGKAFKVAFPKGMAGIHRIMVSREARPLHSEQAVMGRIEEAFGGSARQVDRIAGVVDKLLRCLGEIEGVAKSTDPKVKKPGRKDQEQFNRRILAEAKALTEIAPKADFSATITLLHQICQTLQNAQVWADEEVDEAALNDGDAGIFLNPDLTYDALKETLESMKPLLSSEARASVALHLEALFAQAKEQPDRLLSKAKDAAREAMKLLRAVPVEDKEFAELVEKAASTDAKALEETLAALRAALATLVTRS